jgi:hypothetical protein
MSAIFELHIPHIPPSVGQKNDEERKSSYFFFILCMDLSSTATVYVVFEMEKLRSPHSPTVFSYSTVRGNRVDSFVPITSITGSCSISLLDVEVNTTHARMQFTHV